MNTLLLIVVALVVGFFGGAWMTKHPDETRSVFKRIGDRVTAWITRNEPPSPPTATS